MRIMAACSKRTTRSMAAAAGGILTPADPKSQTLGSMKVEIDKVCFHSISSNIREG